MRNEYRFPRRSPLYRSRHDRVIAGVCGGIAEHLDWSPWGVRLLFILVTFITGIWPVPIVYIIMAMTLRLDPDRQVGSFEDEEFWSLYESSRPTALRKLKTHFDELDKRLQRIESIVTSPGFKYEEDYKNL